MEGYVRNKSPIWRHAMKRAVGPGERIPLDDLYEQYGLKHEIAEGEDFIEWLRHVKLKDVNTWEIKVASGSEEVKAEEKVTKPKKESKNESRQLLKKDSPSNDFVKDSNLKVIDIVQLSVRDAREKLPRLTNVKDLKYSLHEASQLANKDTLCRMLKKRIQELELTSRV